MRKFKKCFVSLLLIATLSCPSFAKPWKHEPEFQTIDFTKDLASPKQSAIVIKSSVFSRIGFLRNNTKKS